MNFSLSIFDTFPGGVCPYLSIVLYSHLSDVGLFLAYTTLVFVVSAVLGRLSHTTCKEPSFPIITFGILLYESLLVSNPFCSMSTADTEYLGFFSLNSSNVMTSPFVTILVSDEL